MRTVYILKGLPASGKTTWAKKKVGSGHYKRVNKDDLRDMLDGGEWGGDNEKFILRLRDHIIIESLKNGKHVIVDDTNLHEKHETRIRQIVRENFPDENIQIKVKEFDVSLKECIERDRERRDKTVGESVIREMYDTYLRPKIVKMEQDTSLPRAIIVDMDGTLADNSHRNPYDASNAHEDGLIEEVADIVRRFADDHTVIIVSARIEEYREPTVKFLDIHGIPYDNLILRKNGDKRADEIVKKEIFEEHIRDKYYVHFIVDDRAKVVKMWRELGLTVLQCAEGNF